ncbi:MAG: hypothetical protein DCC52_00650 [Chloroflexi bacterium]|nr:MAG: hypothetical protein DCC52_00650 [Chloroflexota bacterium]
MSFRKQTLLSLTLALTAIMVAFGLIAHAVITQDAALFERNAAYADLARVRWALDYEQNQLDTLLLDWSTWTDTFEFAKTHNPQFINDYLGPLTFQNSDVQFALVLDAQGQVVYSAEFDPETETLTPVAPELVSAFLAQQDFLGAVTTTPGAHVGLFQADSGVLMLAARPIHDNSGQGPSNGILVFGRRLDAKTAQQLARLANLNLTVLPWSAARVQTLLKQYPKLADDAQAQLAAPLDEHWLQGYARLNDLGGKPVLLAQVGWPRAEYQAALLTLNIGLLALTLIGFVALALILWLTERAVFEPLAALTSQVRAIAATGDFERRVQLTAPRELQDIAKSVNVLLNALHESQRAVAEEQTRYRAIVEDQTEWVIRFLPDGALTFANKAFCRKFEIQDRKWQGVNWFSRLPAETVNALQACCAQLPATPVTHCLLKLNGVGSAAEQHSWTLRAIFNDDGAYTEIQGVGADVSEQYQVEEKLRYLGTHDTLTGLYNRAFFEQELANLTDAAQYPVSIVVADIDAMKWTNDQYGHVAGDALLTATADILTEAFRSHDLIARMGGDEFAVLLRQTPSEIVAQVVARVRTRLMAHNATAVPTLSLSLGWATAQTPAALHATFLLADREMYKEKFARRPAELFENAFGVQPNSEILSLLAHEGSNELLADRMLTASRTAQFEQALQASEARLRALLELLPVVTYVIQLDDAAKPLFISQQINELVGFTAEEWLSHPNMWQERVHPDDRVSVEKQMSQLQVNGPPLDVEYRMLARDGHTVWVQGRARLVRLGQTMVLHGIWLDVTARKEFEAQLAHQNREIKFLFRLTTAMNRGESLGVIFQAALDSLVEMLGVQHASILLYDEQGVMRFVAWHALSDAYRARAEGHSPWARDTKNPAPLLVPDVLAEASLGGLRPIILREGIQALGFIPLLQDETLLGKFMLYYDEVHEFTPEQVQLARAIANQTAVAITRTQERQALEAAKREMEAIFRAVPDIYFRLDADGVILDCQAGARNDFFGMPRDLVGRRIQHVAPQRIAAQLQEALRQCQASQSAVTIEYQLPWPQKEQTFEARFLPIDATQCIIIIRDITARRVSEELNVGLMSLAEQLNSAQTREQAALIVAQATDRLLDWDAFWFIQYTPEETQAYQTVLAFDVRDGIRMRLQNNTTPAFLPFIERAVREKDILLLSQEPESDALSDLSLEQLGDPPGSWLFVQVRYHIRPLGVLALESRAANAYSQASLKVLRSIADQFGMVFARLQVQDDLRAKNVELEQAYDKTIEGWARALELRDTETHGHARRVVDLTIAIARQLGVPEDEIKHIRRGALLHDIGKVGIPDQILLNPKPLTDQEWQVMRMHPVYAHEMLKDISYLDAALAIPYCHHEWWNGQGYPRGLQGEAIPLAARIFAVVDVWDALSSNRAYRARWAPEQVRDYIARQSGAQFDPRVVKVFMELLDEQNFA